MKVMEFNSGYQAGIRSFYLNARGGLKHDFQQHAVISNSKTRRQTGKPIQSTPPYFSSSTRETARALQPFQIPPLAPRSALSGKGPCSFPLPEFHLLEWGWSQVKIMVEYSPGWSPPPLWLWTTFSLPRSEQVHWLITKASLSCEPRTESFAAPPSPILAL